MQHPIPLCEKLIAPLHSITGCATFSCNDCNQTLPVVVDQSLTTLWRDFGQLFHAELLYLNNTCGFSRINCSFQVLPQHLNWD